MSKRPLKVLMAGLRTRPGAPGEPGGRRRRGGRLAGWTSAAVVGALILTSVVVGVGTAGTNARVSDADAWLASLQRSTLVHVNGTTGQVDGRVQLGEAAEGPLEVVQEGDTVLVLDRGTGVVTRVDPAQLSVAQTQTFDGARLRIVVSDDDAWVVDEAAGTVQSIDPVTLAPAAKPVSLAGRPLGGARADEDGVLWVLLPTTGQAVPVGEDGAGEPTKVGEPGDQLRLTVAAGRTAVVNAKAGTLVVLSSEGAGMTMRLPGGLLTADPAKLLVPESNVSPLVPILAPDTGMLVVANVESGVVQAAELDMSKAQSYGPPQAQGARIYIPDTSAGQLLVYDTATPGFAAPIRVTGKPGRLEVHTRGDRVWVNDQANATAAVIDDEGVVHLIDKYDTDAPGAGSPAPSRSATPPGESGRDGDSATPNTRAPSAPPNDGPPGGQDNGSDSDGDSDAGNGSDSDSDPLPAETATQQTRQPEPPQQQPQQPQQTVQPQPVVTVTVTAPAPPAPATTLPPAPPPPAPTGATSSAPNPVPTTGVPTTVGTSTKPSTNPPTDPPAEKGPPGRPKAQTGSGKITITFAPASGATPTRYELQGAPSKSSISPTSVPAKGPFRFDVTNLACDEDDEYSFTVVAVYGTERVASAKSPAVRPCTAPGKPTITGQTRSNHQVVVNWKAPPGSGLTYLVTWKGAGSAPDGEQQTTATSLTIKGLTNGKVYAVTVTAVNAAGKSAAAKTDVDMTPPKKTFKVHHNRPNGDTLGIRNIPHADEGGRAGSIDDGYDGNITVHCQVRGSTESRDDGTGGNSSVWDKVTFEGTSGYVSDVYIATSKSGTNSYSPELWQCE